MTAPKRSSLDKIGGISKRYFKGGFEKLPMVFNCGKSDSVQRLIETNIISDGKKMFVPEGLEVIPIFTKEDNSPSKIHHNTTAVKTVLETRSVHSSEEASSLGVGKRTSNLKNSIEFPMGKVDFRGNKLEKCNKVCTKIEDQIRLQNTLSQSRDHLQNSALFRCVMCSFSSADRLIFEKHTLQHSEMKFYNCKMCSYTTNNITDLRVHTSVHTKNMKSYVCPLCDFTSSFNSNMQKHIKSHAGRKSYKCTDCKFSCASSYKLLQHSFVHTGKFPFKCDKCPYGTASKSNFAKHTTTHNSVQNFKCDFCDYSGTTNVNLKRHMRVHVEMKPYKCKECSYSSKESSKLKRHMKVHANRVPNKCPHCNFKNFRRCNFNRHLRTHKKYVCAECAAVCVDRGKFIRHLKLHAVECDYTTVDESEDENNTAKGENGSL